ncbi:MULTISPECIES: DUF4349 domain-containing protein [unclassified Leeuwenhoekiella]|uniref:DUF4349 domain-containing protein n=1 Tax=unclassified Leeuwenhoekiella TaxID=2615029 RepID=UPI000C4C9072|nr:MULTISPECIES: DUF4349 domain-containing protein [unclassified Leeuwenhoekiella]MAW95978.1 hypothetical protein [Leeuwenhoekiella sp.]MBA79972.1 hypothetical protein [Leeuwenhoekiella sp.]|tara:strand:- start:30657 stop:31475 length:819 start_codon:yes stop_codon:yes gene_type:complete
MKILGFWLLSMIYMCSSGSSEESYATADAAFEEGMVQAEMADDLETDADVQQKIIKSGNLRFETQDLAKTRAQILTAVEATNAYVENERTGKDYRGNYQELQLRIPSKNFQQALELISQGVEFFEEKSISQRDVTEEFIDLEARLKAKRELENRYLELLKKASSVKEILEIERELSVIREEIESKEGRLKYLSKQVSYSTLNVYFYKTEVETGVTKSYGSKILQAFKGGWQGISTFVLGLIYIWPFILLVILSIFLIRRWQKRKSRKNTPKT